MMPNLKKAGWKSKRDSVITKWFENAYATEHFGVPLPQKW
jgi:hypothetical protein